MSTPEVIGTKPMSAIWTEFHARHSIRTQADLEAEGWRTLADIAAELGMSKPGCESALAREERAGRMERCTGKLSNGQRGSFFRPIASA